MKKALILAALMSLVWAQMAQSQSVFTGRVWAPKTPESAKDLPANTGIPVDYFSDQYKGQPKGVLSMPNIRSFGSTDGAAQESIAGSTWELAPRGWYRMSGGAGKYTLMFTGPAHGLGPTSLIRPTMYTNQFVKPGETLDRKVTPHFDYYNFFDGGWDEKAAHQYYQTFTAKGTSITTVGFKAVSDGIDGGGPKSQNVLVSVHEAGAGTPDTWKQIGPTCTVYNMDCGGPKDYEWMAAWNSGDVTTVPGKVYAVCLSTETPKTGFQMYQQKTTDKNDLSYRVAFEGTTGWQPAHIWMAVSSDSDGLLIPYNKCTQREYGEFAGSSTKWTQTYVAQGKSLAGVLLYAATSGIQPSMNRQRVTVRIRKGGPKGPFVGAEKIAIGNANYTGDASWGTFGAVYAPGEVNLEPGKTYAIEFETIENYESLHGFRNIKNMLSDDKPGFNPYKKFPGDNYAHGASYKNGTDKQKFNLDMQIVEYTNTAENWDKAVESKNLVMNGDMEKPDAEFPGVSAMGWMPFAEKGSPFQYAVEGPENKNHFLRVIGGSIDKSKPDGGFVQKVDGLTHMETYRLSGRVRSSYSVDIEHICYVGYDTTGQTDQPNADTIVWTTMTSPHSIWAAYNSEPIRPQTNAISIWLRGKTTTTSGVPFKADFDDFALYQVKSGVPQ